MQGLAYNIVKLHFDDISSDKEPLCLIIIGVAGTGKSYLINAISNLLREKCAVTATTGKASYNIRGITIHYYPLGQGVKKILQVKACVDYKKVLMEFNIFSLMNILCSVKLLLAG